MMDEKRGRSKSISKGNGGRIRIREEGLRVKEGGDLISQKKI